MVRRDKVDGEWSKQQRDEMALTMASETAYLMAFRTLACETLGPVRGCIFVAFGTGVQLSPLTMMYLGCLLRCIVSMDAG